MVSIFLLSLDPKSEQGACLPQGLCGERAQAGLRGSEEVAELSLSA